MPLTDQEFRLRADDALEQARLALTALSDAHGFEIELQQGVLILVFEEPRAARFIVSPNAPVHQVWISAMSRSFKLPWSDTEGTFALNGETLPYVLQRLVHQFLELGTG